MIRSYPKENVVGLGIILFLIAFAYGLLSPWLGFYWDDWVFVWILHFFGPLEFIEAFRPFRPLLGPIFTVTTSIFRDSAFGWQIFGLFIRYLLSLSLWWCLRHVWPAQKWNILWVVFLFSVFPGYGQQWVALTHVNQEFISFICLVLSFGITASAARKLAPGIKTTVFAIFLQFLGLFTTEYFFGLEIIRFLFLGVIFAEKLGYRWETLRSAIRAWLPYLMVWILNAAWFYYYYQSNAYDSYHVGFLTTSKLNPLNLVNEVLNVISLSGFVSWTRTLGFLSFLDGSLTSVLVLSMAVLSTIVVFFSMRSSTKTANDSADHTSEDLWSKQALVIGLIAMLAGRIPSWAASLPLKLEFDFDRLIVSTMLGASLFIIGMFVFILKTGLRKVIILSLLVGFSVAYQFSLSNTFRRDWQNQRNFLSELTWRIPALEPNTTILTYQLPILYASDMQLTAPINWIYAPELNTHELPYLLLDTKSRLNTPALPSFHPDSPISFTYRTSTFTGTTSQSIVIFKDANGCLRVLDKTYGTAETVPGASYLLTDAIGLSDLSRIKADSTQASALALFGAEPSPDWCYFYEKAELARQNQQWEEITRLYRQATDSGFVAKLPVENLPFIEAFANSGDWETSLALTVETFKSQRELCPALLSLWARIPPQDTNQKQHTSEIISALKELGCK
jgi:hypothetical protein